MCRGAKLSLKVGLAEREGLPLPLPLPLYGLRNTLVSQPEKAVTQAAAEKKALSPPMSRDKPERELHGDTWGAGMRGWKLGALARIDPARGKSSDEKSVMKDWKSRSAGSSLSVS